MILGIFVIFPVIYGIGISLFDYNPLNATNTFLGLENYKKLLQDDVFWKAVKNTIFFCVVAVALNIIITLFLAKIISVIPNKILRNVFRTILFIPCIAPMVGTSLIWKYGILATNGGVLNTILKWFGISPTNWFMTTTPMMMLIIVYTLWADLGYNVILFTAGMDNVPEEFEEAAILDGANAVQRFFRVKLPLMKRTFAFVSIMTMANYFQMKFFVF